MEIKSFFDIVSIILEKKPIPSDEDIQKHCNQFMICSMLSCDVQLAGIAHQMSMMKVSNKMFFDCLYNGIPKCKKYIKWNATKAKKEEQVTYLMRYFNCSQSNAKLYIQLIEKSELEYITKIYENRGRVK